MSAYTLEDVRSMDEIFHGRTGHYIFASSTRDLRPRQDPGRSARRTRWTFPRSRSSTGATRSSASSTSPRAYWDHGFPASMVPFASVFGPHNMIKDREQRMFVRLLQGRPALVPGDGTTLGQIGHVDDEAKALRMMMLNPQHLREALQPHRQGLLHRRGLHRHDRRRSRGHAGEDSRSRRRSWMTSGRTSCRSAAGRWSIGEALEAGPG